MTFDVARAMGVVVGGAALALSTLWGCEAHQATPAPPPVPRPAPNPTPPPAVPAARSFPSVPAPAALPAGVATTPRPTLDDAPDPDVAYPWARHRPSHTSLAARFPAPKHTVRRALAASSYAHWLRHLPLRAPGTAVRAYDGRVILDADDPRLGAVVDLDLIGEDLQQCADTVLRLRAEYLRVRGDDEAIRFTYTNGWTSAWPRWRDGWRPRVVGPRDVRVFRRRADDSRDSFNAYLRDLFSYAGTISLAREAEAVLAADVRGGDFFILPGGPGHVVVVLDLAEHDETGERFALLGQGFMPAQDFHVLRAAPERIWFRLDPRQPIATPMWDPFPWSALRRLSRHDS
ncbi:MAG: DUF4846 domain-containing protein [Myxococcota bacterium]